MPEFSLVRNLPELSLANNFIFQNYLQPQTFQTCALPEYFLHWAYHIPEFSSARKLIFQISTRQYFSLHETFSPRCTCQIYYLPEFSHVAGTFSSQKLQYTRFFLAGTFHLPNFPSAKNFISKNLLCFALTNNKFYSWEKKLFGKFSDQLNLWLVTASKEQILLKIKSFLSLENRIHCTPDFFWPWPSLQVVEKNQDSYLE